MAHKLEIRSRGDGRFIIAGPDLDVRLVLVALRAIADANTQVVVDGDEVK